MSRKRTVLQMLGLALAALLVLVSVVVSPGSAHGQMVRYGSVNIQNETESVLFHSLLCPCGGCVRESLASCLCSTAHQLRAETRGELAAGKSVEEIQAWYAGRFGTEHIAIPPNTGGHRLLYLLPLGAIVIGAGFVIMTLRRWNRRSLAAKPAGAKAAGGVAPEARDDYDEKLDEELRNLDRE